MTLNVTVAIQAAGQGLRLGRGPKAFVELNGEPLLCRAVRNLQPFASQMLVAIAPQDLQRARDLLSGTGAELVEGGETRSETTRILVEAARAEMILLHDVVHPFASHELVRSLLEAARQHGAAAPAIPNTAFLYGRDGSPLHAPGQALAGQKPVAFSRVRALQGYAAGEAASGTGDPSLMEVLGRAGIRTTFVLGSSINIKITTPDDLLLAEAIVGRLDQ